MVFAYVIVMVLSKLCNVSAKTLLKTTDYHHAKLYGRKDEKQNFDLIYFCRFLPVFQYFMRVLIDFCGENEKQKKFNLVEF